MRVGIDDLPGAIDIISARIEVVHLTRDSADFLAAGCWVDIQRIADGWRVRVYKGLRMVEREAESANQAIDVARTVVRSLQRHRE